ncbi:MAG TPA: aspartate-semialdehyde dehydrogenase [Terriglobia bacterium]|nr:aspartate-semialdehyde dehydrogenase [Terriglobia bacterium]
MKSKLKVGIFAATGTVGQRLIQLLANHPWFEVTAVAASDSSAGKKYAQATRWMLDTPMPESVAELTVQTCTPDVKCDFALSSLPTEVAEKVELEVAKAGIPVISNASSHRMKADVPLLIPEINPDHLDALTAQKQRITGKGFIVTNPNCTTIGLVFPLAALYRKFGVEAVSVVTMQALSGAGYPGVASLDILDNVLPAIGRGGEDQKVETEPLKLLGQWKNNAFVDAPIRMSAQTHRVNVRDGHMEAVSVKLSQKASRDEVESAIRDFRSPIDELELPSAPRPAIIVERDIERPQPRLDRDRGNGMAVVVGPVQPCAVLDYKFRLCSHNTIRGAAGAAILNAELLYKKGMLG